MQIMLLYASCVSFGSILRSGKSGLHAFSFSFFFEDPLSVLISKVTVLTCIATSCALSILYFHSICSYFLHNRYSICGEMELLCVSILASLCWLKMTNIFSCVICCSCKKMSFVLCNIEKISDLTFLFFFFFCRFSTLKPGTFSLAHFSPWVLQWCQFHKWTLFFSACLWVHEHFLLLVSLRFLRSTRLFVFLISHFNHKQICWISYLKGVSQGGKPKRRLSMSYSKDAMLFLGRIAW